jgi:hypothetical protein
MFFSAIFVAIFSVSRALPRCPDVPEIQIPFESPNMTCSQPLEASIQYLTSDTPISGPCVMFHTHQRFDRFREWLNSIGGYVSPKVTFRKMNPACGGLFLKDNEYLLQGELLFDVPDEASFNYRMINRVFPWLLEFEFAGSIRFWQSLALAGLLRHKPEIVGPWQALLPDLSFHPMMWPESELRELKSTHAYVLIRAARDYISSGCESFEKKVMRLMDVNCRDVLEAHAIIVSRAFGLEKGSKTNEGKSAIPFGPDLLNHSPHSASWTSHVKYGSAKNPKKIDTIFMLLGFGIDKKRELFNNYGSHSFPRAMAMYGFTAPDTHDELVIHATTHARFSGKRFDVTNGFYNSCPAEISVVDVWSVENIEPFCPRSFDNEMEEFDEGGSFRLTNRDLIAFFPQDDFPCPNPVDSFAWRYAKKRLWQRQVRVSGHQLDLNLNTKDGTEPWIPYSNTVWMALCSLPAWPHPAMVDSLVEAASTCEPVRNENYLEEFPKSLMVKDLSRTALYDLCSWYEENVMGSLGLNLNSWIAYRNQRILRENMGREIEVIDISAPLNYESNQEFMELLELIVSNKKSVFSDNGGLVAETMVETEHRSTRRVYQLEEIYRYKMQTVYMVIRKCRQPLEHVLHAIE